MASSSQLKFEGKVIGTLNKVQRYACIHKCAAYVGSAEEAKEIESLIEAERQRDFSDTDDVEQLKY